MNQDALKQIILAQELLLAEVFHALQSIDAPAAEVLRERLAALSAKLQENGLPLASTIASGVLRAVGAGPLSGQALDQLLH